MAVAEVTVARVNSQAFVVRISFRSIAITRVEPDIPSSGNHVGRDSAFLVLLCLPLVRPCQIFQKGLRRRLPRDCGMVHGSRQLCYLATATSAFVQFVQAFSWADPADSQHSGSPTVIPACEPCSNSSVLVLLVERQGLNSAILPQAGLQCTRPPHMVVVRDGNYSFDVGDVHRYSSVPVPAGFRRLHLQ